MKQNRLEISRLLVAAVVSRRFRKLLLTEPAKAIENGWNGETFCFTSAERQLILSIVAELPSGNGKTLEEFAWQIAMRTCKIECEPDDSL